MTPPNVIISIITVVRNGASTLENAIASAAMHGCPGVEYIVIDGGSTDGTVELIKQHANTINLWVSEPDRGLYDAMNKGVRLAKGKWILFLGCDDELALNLSVVLPLLQDEHALYYGDSYWRHAKRTYDGPFTAAKLALTNICQQGIFYPRQALDKYPFDLRYRYQADWVVNMQCFHDPAFAFRHLPHTIAIYNDVTGLSSVHADLVLEQDYPALMWRYFPWPIALWRSGIAFGGRALRKLGWKGRPAYTKR
ncbi:MAG: glycosyltransferase family 2 protein [bacterium]